MVKECPLSVAVLEGRSSIFSGQEYFLPSVSTCKTVGFSSLDRLCSLPECQRRGGGGDLVNFLWRMFNAPKVMRGGRGEREKERRMEEWMHINPVVSTSVLRNPQCNFPIRAHQDPVSCPLLS